MARNKDRIFYDQIWRIVDGAVRDTYRTHPEYLKGYHSERIIRTSIVKRVTGTLMGYGAQSPQGRRLMGGG